MVFIIALVISFSRVGFSDISFFPFTSLVGQIVYVEQWKNISSLCLLFISTQQIDYLTKILSGVVKGVEKAQTSNDVHCKSFYEIYETGMAMIVIFGG